MIKNTKVYELVKEKIEKKFAVPEHVRDKVWNEVEYDQGGFILLERRPHFQDSKIITKLPIFKIKYHSKKKNWSVYWMPSDGKWHYLKSYVSLDNILKYINENSQYFWG